MKDTTRQYAYRYSWWDRVRVNLAGFILGESLWGRLSADLRSIYVKAYLSRR